MKSAGLGRISIAGKWTDDKLLQKQPSLDFRKGMSIFLDWELLGTEVGCFGRRTQDGARDISRVVSRL